MSVYTTVSREQLEPFLQNYAVGNLHSFVGIAAGIENTNYFVETSGGRWVLTLFERQDGEDLPYFLGLMDHLATAGIPSARPVADANGCFLSRLNGRSAALVKRLPGASIMRPEARHCATIGAIMADMHSAGADFPHFRANTRGHIWWVQTAPLVASRLGREDGELLRDEVAYQERYHQAGLPGGVIHADLFRDNALFQGDELTGVIDFYYACNDAFIYDLAVAVNDWCADDDGEIQAELMAAFVGAYQRKRPFSDAERAAWPAMLRAGALRFWLSRLYDHYFPRGGEIIQEKDPEPFRRLLIQHRRHAGETPGI